TLDAMREVRFDSSYSFAFSSRPGTAAEALPGQIEEEVKKERLAKLQQLQDEHTQERLQQWNGRTTEVLLDGFMKSDAQRLQGRNSQNVLVHLDRPYHDIGPGMTVPVRIHRVSRYTLHGERIEG
ncbi:tRNA (N6-isopentenyl adenosine(37)-C2)-methylthiotransferase MiaB, partial [bacterium]|nr:tRNA (N6-isopentenyl adenosine(37)-C2)-methylthiotransferase MiaB [bacterium]